MQAGDKDTQRTRPTLAVCAVGTLIAGGPAQAGGPEQSISAPVSVERDSNVAMSATGKRGVTRTIFNPTYGLTSVDGTDTYKLDLGLRVERSSDQTLSANRADPNLALGWQHETPTNLFGLTLKYDEASARTSELETTGVVSKDGTRRSSSLGGNWRGEATERTYLTADAEYKTVTFDRSALNSFDNISAGVAWNYQWTESSEPFLRFSASHYDPRSPALRSSDNYALTGGIKIKTSDKVEWTAHAGPSCISGASSSTGWQGGIATRYAGQRHDWSADIGRTIDASGQGGFVKADQIKGTWGWSYDELTRIGADASWQDSKGNLPNTMKQVGIWASRELSLHWNARFSLAYKERQQAGQATATGNVLGVTFVYSHPSF